MVRRLRFTHFAACLLVSAGCTTPMAPACMVSRDCASPMICVAGACVDPSVDVGAMDGGLLDGGSGDAGSADAGPRTDAGPGGPLVIEMVPVGNAGNPADPRGGLGRGDVAYPYQMGRFEVTAAQYTAFLNAVAATDTYGLYHVNMGRSEMGPPGPPSTVHTPDQGWGCGIQRSGAPGSYSYSVAADWANRPVNHVSWGDAARFVNWLENGQPTGAQDDSTTEAGTYPLHGAVTAAALMLITREGSASGTWVLPTEDEWYKAAFHQNDGATDHYYSYPSGPSLSETDYPANTILSVDPGNHGNFFDQFCGGTCLAICGVCVNLDADPAVDPCPACVTTPPGPFSLGAPYWATEVGTFANSASPYGTFDQGGNVWEWNETAIGETRAIRGGGWNEDFYFSLATNMPYADNPTFDYDHRFGFRVARLD